MLLKRINAGGAPSNRITLQQMKTVQITFIHAYFMLLKKNECIGAPSNQIMLQQIKMV